MSFSLLKYFVAPVLIISSIINVARSSPPLKGTLAVLNKSDQTVSLYNLEKAKAVITLPTGKSPHEGVFLTDSILVISNYESQDPSTLTVIDISKKKVIQTISLGKNTTPHGITAMNDLESKSFPIRVKFTHDGRFVLVSNMRSNHMSVFDAKKPSEVKRIPLTSQAVSETAGRLFRATRGPAPIGIIVHPNNQIAFVANSMADQVVVIDFIKGKVIQSMKTGREPDGLAFSPRTIL